MSRPWCLIHRLLRSVLLPELRLMVTAVPSLFQVPTVKLKKKKKNKHWKVEPGSGEDVERV